VKWSVNELTRSYGDIRKEANSIRCNLK